MQIKEFEKELKKIDERLEIVSNPNRPGLANIKLGGRDVCPVPDGEIKEDPDPDYYYTFPNGMSARHKSRAEALSMVESTLEYIKTPEGKDIFFN